MAELITGASGQLGKELGSKLPDAISADRNILDIADRSAVQKFNWGDITTIINAAAYTKVDEAESPGGVVSAWRANALGPANLAAIANKHSMSILHVSTDYVFDGKNNSPYLETDDTSPLSIYGLTKAAGELAIMNTKEHYIVRTSWVIGDGPNFVRTMLKLGSQHDSLKVVNDQFGRPTFATDLAASIRKLLSKRPPAGIYNSTNSGDTVSWAEVARSVFKLAEINCKIVEISTEEYTLDKSPSATRPQNSVLDLAKLEGIGINMPDWRQSLINYIDKELK